MWEKGLGLEQYLEKHNISQDVLKSLDKDDEKLIHEVGYSYRYFELIASNGVLLQTLLPIGDELQAHLYRTHTGYKIEIIPISYQQDTHIALLEVDKSPHTDISNKIKNKRLAGEFTRVLKHSVDFRGIQKKDKIAIVYDQKMRLGQPLSIPDIKVAMLESHGHKNYVFKHTDGKYYNEKGNVLVQKYMQKPLKHVRITSPFTNRRFHPVLKRWKAHHGTDFGARRGTPILAAADGEVIFSGWKGGYGKVIKIQHKDGYVTLYAHQSRLKVNKGTSVKAGQIIGYVGSTGRSTGPHLHFGLYKNGRAIDPMRMVKFSTEGLTGKGKKAFLNRKTKYTQIINKIFEDNIPSYVWNSVDTVSVVPSMKKYYQNRGW
ncbi:MAG: Membrane proteins related to metalloendopeptidases [uncultured Sulfurovum sp.]|uniref:Membrane proteins related to metalloendopeptidases n=1 Tax=uncultured Sulfurovum sp. TaxID=269237 RepID=A0A6S6TID2_9BACT|nr:MAG: Membrane proteins related to metalloendopeptidases [uncultured Sulfurovum sp.]